MILRKAVICLLLLPHLAHSQDEKPELVQFSGVVMSSDSLRGVPFAHIIIKDFHRGTISNYQGFFSFVAAKGDTIVFSSIGYKKQEFAIPDSLRGNKYSVIQLMTRDTIYLPETIIYPWPSPEQFREAFLTLDIPDDDYERAKKNLERERLKELGDAMAMDGNQNSDYYTRQAAAKFYYNGQYPPLNIFDPLRWKEFFEAWKNGDFKRK